MLIKRMLLGVAALVTLSLVTADAHAGEWVAGTKITDVREFSGGFGFIFTESTDNPQGCAGNPSYRRVEAENLHLLKYALAAMLAEKTVDILVEGCFSHSNPALRYPIVDAINVNVQ